MSNQVKKLSFRELFSENIQFVIPFFQRGYSWTVDNWRLLLNDLREEIINEIGSNDNHKDFEHFFSSIVVMPKSDSSFGGSRKFDVLDGQQRITTVYIFLATIKNILQNRIDDEVAKNFVNIVSQFLANSTQFGEDDDYKKLKIFSNKGDRYQTYKVVFQNEPNTPLLSFDQQFKNHDSQVKKFEKWLTSGSAHYRIDNLSTEELILLANVILDCLKIVWIPLEQHSNNAQAIFESLNAKGTPLEPFELLCNYIFRGFEDTDYKEVERYYNDYWIYTENKIGDRDFDNYIMHLYSIGQNKNIGKGRKIYTHFKKNNPIISYENSIKHLKQLREMAAFYQLVNNPIRTDGIDNRIIIFLQNIKATQMLSVTPFLMQLLKNYVEQKITLDSTIEILQEVLTMIVRVKIVGQSTTKVSELFPSLYDYISSQNDYIEALHQKFKDYDYYIDDDYFTSKFVNKSLYATSNTEFVRMILIEIDKKKHLFGQFPDYSTIHTIEHICPQGDRGRDETGWTEYLAEDADNDDLYVSIHSIGNLTLLSRPANSHASNNPFSQKVKSYHDLTFLNRDIKEREQSGIKWNVEAIKERSKTLVNIALDIWSWKNER